MMIINDSREKQLLMNKEKGEASEQPKSLTSTRLWSSLRNPRIVRVSRSFGGKDRHSKVTTIRGLRDRRVRLSVPTAIQLYDLQDKLGLNQPSKVVDWLLNAARNEIEKLPPLPDFIQFPQTWDSNSTSSTRINGADQEITINNECINSSARLITQQFGFDPVLLSSNAAEENEAPHHYLEPAVNVHLSQADINPPGFLFNTSSSPSSYGNITPSYFQIPSTFAQLLPLCSTRSSQLSSSNETMKFFDTKMNYKQT